MTIEIRINLHERTWPDQGLNQRPLCPKLVSTVLTMPLCCWVLWKGMVHSLTGVDQNGLNCLHGPENYQIGPIISVLGYLSFEPTK